MNGYKFINAENLAEEIKKLLQAEIAKIHFPPEFVECELTDDWFKDYIDACLQDADDVMDGALIDEYAMCMGLVADYNKHIFGVDDKQDDELFNDLVKRVRREDHHAQTTSDLLFLNSWYLKRFAQDNIINPFVKMVKEWAYEWA